MPIRLLLITDSQRFPNHQAMLDVIALAIDHGVDAVLLREPHLDSAKLLALAANLRRITREKGAKLIIHTQADIAKAIDADGVHVRAKSIHEIAKIRVWFASPILISASCHHQEELLLAEQQGADFVFLSPVFPTQSHPGEPSLGLQKFNSLRTIISIPVLALGGIVPSNRYQLSDVGIATLSAILDASNPGQMAQDLLPLQT